MCVVSAVRVLKICRSRPRFVSAKLHARHMILGEVMEWTKLLFLRAKVSRSEAVWVLVFLIRQ